MIYVACCSDEAYALHAIMALRSASLNTNGEGLHGFVFDCGITQSTRARCEWVLRQSAVSYTWKTVNTSSIADLPTSTWVSPAGNVRLLLPKLLPNCVDRVLYLDSDVLVLSDIADLWKKASMLAMQQQLRLTPRRVHTWGTVRTPRSSCLTDCRNLIRTLTRVFYS